jgi:hypothetical protein
MTDAAQPSLGDPLRQYGKLELPLTCLLCLSSNLLCAFDNLNIRSLRYIDLYLHFINETSRDFDAGIYLLVVCRMVSNLCPAR